MRCPACNEYDIPDEGFEGITIEDLGWPAMCPFCEEYSLTAEDLEV